MSDNILITTTVGLDCDIGEPQKVIHLVQGDYGTRALRLIPVTGGRLIHMDEAGVVAAKVRLHCSGQESLLINCVLGDVYVELVPTQAMVAEADEWSAQLVLLDESNMTVSSAPFTISVHGTVYEGDTVEHTNSSVIAVYYDEQGRVCIEKQNGEIVKTAGPWQHAHDLATEQAPGFMSAEDRAKLNELTNYLDQAVKTTSSPTFGGLTIGTLVIGADGSITGARFV